MVRNEIRYPYLPEGRSIGYVPAENEYIVAARNYAETNSLDKTMPGAAVVVKDGEIIGIGANGSLFHKTNVCRRVELGCKSGEGYELCEGCHPKNHSEPSAILDATNKENDTKGADLYLWGHWWFCEPCWYAMIEASISNVFLLENSEVLFDREHPDNVVGKQFIAL